MLEGQNSTSGGQIGNKTDESGNELIRDDVLDSRSENDLVNAPSGDEGEASECAKRKRYHRHSQLQIQQMEAFFQECPHPDDKQRKDLACRLGLEPLQVKFWFQNKRTQMKAHNEHNLNAQLRTENEKLRADNTRYKEALRNLNCANCGGMGAIGGMSPDAQNLMLENTRLRNKIDRISGMAANYLGKNSLQFLNLPPGARRPLDAEKPKIIQLAVAAMEELITMAQSGEPLWSLAPDSCTEILNSDEYCGTFPHGIGPKHLGLKSEASRESAVVIMNHMSLVGILMEVNQWSRVFASIVSKAETLEVLSTRVAGNYNGALQVMTAEFQVPTPLVPTRDSYFVRYCKQHAEGTWAVVDVSLDFVELTSIQRCRRRPSGCLIQEMPNGYSKVIWVEHVEVDNGAVHDIYKPMVNSGLAFGARRWVAILDRQCERLASVTANSISAGDAGVVSSPEGKKSMLKLAERIVISFCNGVGSSTGQTWTVLTGTGADDHVRVMIRKSTGYPGRPFGVVLSASTSFWLPVSAKRVFDFLRDVNSRNEWDILSNGGLVEELTYIGNGRYPGNAVSLLHVNNANSNRNNMLVLQESSTDQTGSSVVYAQLDIGSVNMILGGGDPHNVAFLPSGFAILPNVPIDPSGGVPEPSSGGSLVTIAFQILEDLMPTAMVSLSSVSTIEGLIKCTVSRIKRAMLVETARSSMT